MKRTIQIVHWGVNSSMSDGQVPSDKTSVDETKFSTTSFRKLEALSPVATELASTVARS